MTEKQILLLAYAPLFLCLTWSLTFQKIITGWQITNLSYDELLDESSERKAFIYLDPPYAIKDSLYGKKGSMHKGFDHDQFALDCADCSMDMLISYNSDQLVKNRFDSWFSAEFDHTYTLRSVGKYMREQKDRKELLLLNYEKSLETLELCSGKKGG